MRHWLEEELGSLGMIMMKGAWSSSTDYPKAKEGLTLGWPGGEVKVTKKKIKPFSSLSWP